MPPFVRALRDPRASVLACAFVFSSIAITWGLPGSDTWAADAISPRACGLGAIAETYLPGHFHIYPPLHMLLLSIVSLPAIVLTATHAGTHRDALERALIESGPMTAIEVAARVVAVAMLVGIVWNTMTLWSRLAGRRAGVAAGAVVATNATLVYYAHTGNLEVPYLFWSTLAFVELDRVFAGERAPTRAVLAMAAAALTKDQAAGLFVLVVPVVMTGAGSGSGSGSGWRGWAKALGFGAVVYAVVSGAIVNPTGFAARIRMLLGPASSDWAAYPATLEGRVAIARDVALSVPRYTSWPLMIAAVVGVAIAARRPGRERVRALLPLLGAASFTLFFTLAARRTEDRFVLPQSVLLLPYAALALDAWLSRSRPRTAVPVLGCALAFLPAALAVASVDATLIGDSRYSAERFLASLPAGARVEVYGGPRFIPRLPESLAAVRVGTDDPAGRSHVPGLAELRDDPARVVERRPDYVLLSTEFSRPEASWLGRARFGVTTYARLEDAAFFGALQSGALGYERIFRATCELPWPLECRKIHGSTGEEVWIYARRTRD